MLRVTIGLNDQMNPLLHKHVEKIKPRSRAEVIRRLAEIGLMFEKGLLSTRHDTSKMDRKGLGSDFGSIAKDQFDHDILKAFSMEV